MKRHSAILPMLLVLSVAMTASFCGCSDKTDSDAQRNTDTATASAADVDLTLLSSTMIYAEVNNMMTTPADYIGKVVRMSGMFSVYTDETSGKNYFAVIVADATACCQQGIEFVLDGDYTYPDDYPELGSDITVCGTFNTYNEREYLYCQLESAVIEK